MAEYSVDGARWRPDPGRVLGVGGEAVVYALDETRALKLFKDERHPDVAGDPARRAAVRERLALHQRKLLAFPLRLPDGAIQPIGLVKDQTGRIAGYTMRRIPDAVPLLHAVDPARSGSRLVRPPLAGVTLLLERLRALLAGVHDAGVVVGDLNDLNVLVAGPVAEPVPYLIDLDSAQFGEYRCVQYTAAFLDPRVAAPADGARARQGTAAAGSAAGSAAGTGLALVGRLDRDTDWYAFAVLVAQALLGVHPYGGLFRPSDPAARCPDHLRPFRRITVFHPDVRYPKPALPLAALPEPLREHLRAVFVDDRRGAFPPALLALRWRRCDGCGREHARSHCPICAPAALAAAERRAPRPAAVARHAATAAPPVPAGAAGGASWRTLVAGAIVAAGADAGRPCWLLHAPEHGTTGAGAGGGGADAGAGVLSREDGAVVARGVPDPRSAGITVLLGPGQTVLARGGSAVVVRSGAPARRHATDGTGAVGGAAVALGGGRRFWLDGGVLYRDGTWEDEALGGVLAGQTRLWAGPRFGVALGRADALPVAAVFSTAGGGLRDVRGFPSIEGHLLGATAAIDELRAWVFVATRAGGRTRHRCVVLDARGDVEAIADGAPGDGSWLSAPFGACAVGGFLLVPTDEGITRVDAAAGVAAATRAFPAAEPHVAASSLLAAVAGGVLVASPERIGLLALDAPPAANGSGGKTGEADRTAGGGRS